MGYNVVVVDDHELTLEGVVRALDGAEDINVVGTADSGSQVMSLVRRTKPDLVLLDVNLPDVDGMTCLGQIKRSHPDVKVVMLSGFSDPGHVEGAFENGATAYIVKSVKPCDLPSAVRNVCRGSVYHSFANAAGHAAETGGEEDFGLTERERTILSALARGLSNKAISAELWVSQQTVKFHLNNIYRKLDVTNRAAAVRFAYEHGMVAGGQPARA